MQQACVRICKCLGSDFVPFLPYVMPPLLTSASAKTDLTIVDGITLTLFINLLIVYSGRGCFWQRGLGFCDSGRQGLHHIVAVL